MISLREFDDEQSSEQPKNPLKEWRQGFEVGTLTAKDLIEFFEKASPFFFTIDKTTDFSDLGKHIRFRPFAYRLRMWNEQFIVDNNKM